MKNLIIILLVLVGLFFFIKYAMPLTYTGFVSDISRFLGNTISAHQ